jgi:uncharacterized membrane protein
VVLSSGLGNLTGAKEGERVSDLIVLVFDDEKAAFDALADLRRVEKEGAVQFDDTAVVSKDAHGKLHKKNEASTATEVGAVAGGFLGLLLMGLFPIAGIALGVLGGATVGALLDQGVDRKFVKEVSDSLEPGKSALFLLVRNANAAMLDVFKPYSGRIYQTTLSEDLENRLTRALA